MRLLLRRGDICTSTTDAIVTSANRALQGNSHTSHWRFNGRKNVDGTVHSAAGPKLLEACMSLSMGPQGRCPPLCARATPSFGSLRANIVVHAVAPDAVYGTGTPLQLRTTFRAALAAAEEYGAQSVAFPALGCGVNGWHPAIAAHEALDAVQTLRASGTSKIQRIEFVLLEHNVWSAWQAVVQKRIGPKSDSGTLEDGTEAQIWQVPTST